MSIALSDNTGWEELIVVDPNNVEESERNALRRLTALIKERDPDVIEGHDLFRVHLPLSCRPREETENQTRLGTQWRLSPLAPVTAANRGENYRLSEVHDRWPPFRRHIFAGAILRRRHAFSRRVRKGRCRPTFRSLR